MYLWKETFFWKNMLVVIYAKIFFHCFIPTIYENFKISFFTYLGQMKIWKLSNLFFCFRKKQFWGTFSGSYFNKGTLSQRCKISCSVDTTWYSHTHFTWLSSTIKQLLGKFYFEFLNPFIFFCTWKKLVLASSLWRFDIILHIRLIHLLFFIRYSNKD